MPIKLGELLLKENMVSPQQFQDALSHQRKNGGKLARAFVALGLVRDEEITSLLSRQYGVPSISLDNFEVDPAIIRIIPAETARKYQLLPLSRSGVTLTIAMADPTNVFAMDDIKFTTGYNVEPVVASEAALEEAIGRYYGSPVPPGPQAAIGEARPGPTLGVDDLAPVGDLSEVDLGNLVESADASPVVKLTNVLLVDCLRRGASDIHIEPYEKEFRVRFRIDGVLYNVMALPTKLRDPLTSRIKIMARLDITQRRLPQDGRLGMRLRVGDKSRDLDFRVSVVPTLWGEKIVLRLLDRSKLVPDMTKLGFEPRSLERLRRAIARPRGLVVVSGPSGSGRTTTLYSALAALNTPDRNLMTTEDPPAFSFPGVNQVAMSRTAGATGATPLAAVADLDTDVVLAGDIEDVEAARAAVLLSRRGCLVLATLDAGDTPSTLVRLLRMGIDPDLVASAVTLVLAQRLVRRICTKCRADASAETPPKTLAEIGFRPAEIGRFRVMKGRGCPACSGTGYRGRVGLYEVVEVSEGIRDLVREKATAGEVNRRALEEGMVTLRRSGLEKIKAGVSTLAEVLRATPPDPAGAPLELSPTRSVSRPRPAATPVATPVEIERERETAPPRRKPEPGGGERCEDAGTRLANAHAEIAALEQRLLQQSCSNILVAEVANANALVAALTLRLCEAHAYKRAYEQLRGGREPAPRTSG